MEEIGGADDRPAAIYTIFLVFSVKFWLDLSMNLHVIAIDYLCS